MARRAPITNGERPGAPAAGREVVRRALARDELSLRFQPIVRTEDETVAGFEALAGWDGPAGFAPLGDHLLDFAEGSGLAQRADRRALALVADELACSELPRSVEWISVNVAPGSLMEPEVAMRAADLADRLDRAGLGLIVEISEGKEGHLDPLSAVVELSWLRRSGVRVALDDFGKKPTLVGRLLHFPVDVVKVDARGPEDGFRRLSDPWGFTRGLVCLARSLGRDVVLNHVDDRGSEGASLVGEADFAQGDLFGAPARLGEAA